jgi:hypothetical protein
MKFGMDVMPLQATSYLNFLFPTISNTEVTDARACEVKQGSPVMPLSMILRGDVIARDVRLYAKTTRKRLNGFSLNLVLTYCHWRLL